MINKQRTYEVKSEDEVLQVLKLIEAEDAGDMTYKPAIKTAEELEAEKTTDKSVFAEEPGEFDVFKDRKNELNIHYNLDKGVNKNGLF